jgi:hypothetical protein
MVQRKILPSFSLRENDRQVGKRVCFILVLGVVQQYWEDSVDYCEGELANFSPLKTRTWLQKFCQVSDKSAWLKMEG